VSGLEGWWVGFFSYFASGPPGDRLAQLLALSDAGVVRFVGADMWLRTDEDHGRFLAGSASTDHVVAATALVDARLPRATMRYTADGLLRALATAGAGIEETLVDERAAVPLTTGLLRVAQDGRLLDAAGRPHPRRFALGAYTTSRTAAAFARPHTNAPSFRATDAAARAALSFLRSEPAESVAATEFLGFRA
jgi:hypothetical protein